MPNVSKYLRLLLLVTAAMPLWDLGHPLWEVDDARYAEVPREMVETGDWLTPHLDYVDYIQKPPLIYWLTATSYKLFGVSESTSRLPLVLLAWLGMLCALWLGAWLVSAETGVWAAVILGTSAEFSMLSHLHTPDLALTVFLAWGVALMLRTLLRPSDSAWAAPTAGISLGLAFLSKGLVAWLLPGAWIVMVCLFSHQMRKHLKLQALVVGALASALVVGPWLWAMSSRHPRFLEHFFIEQHFQRFLTPQFNRPGPWYYFLGVETIGLLPWTPLVFAALAIAARNWKRMEAGEQALLVWVLLVFGFFSASHSKLPTYILPLFPQQCVLAAGLLTRLSSGKEKRPWLDSLHRALGIILCASLPVAYFFFAHRPPPLAVTAPMLMAVVAAVMGMAAGWIFPKFLPWSAFLLTECLLIGAQAAEPWLSARDLARTVQTRCPMDAPIIAYDVYLHGLPFYTGRKIDQLVNWVGEFDYVKADPRFAPMFGDDNTIRNLGRGHRLACVILQRREKAYFGSLVRSEDLVFVGSAAGPWTLALVGLPAR